MIKRPKVKKKTLDKASSSKIEGTTPHHDGFHCESLEVSESIEKTRQYHTRYLRAINSPLRREILRALKRGSATIEDLQSSTGLDEDTLKWHLSVLEHGFCVEKGIKKSKLVYKLTQEGRVIDYLE